MEYKEKVAQAERLAELLEAAYRGLELNDKIDGVTTGIIPNLPDPYPAAVIYFSHAYNEARHSTDNGALYLPYDTGIEEILKTLYAIEAQPLKKA